MGFELYRINLQLGTESISLTDAGALAVANQGIKALRKRKD